MSEAAIHFCMAAYAGGTCVYVTYLGVRLKQRFLLWVGGLAFGMAVAVLGLALDAL